MMLKVVKGDFLMGEEVCDQSLVSHVLVPSN